VSGCTSGRKDLLNCPGETQAGDSFPASRRRVAELFLVSRAGSRAAVGVFTVKAGSLLLRQKACQGGRPPRGRAAAPMVARAVRHSDCFPCPQVERWAFVQPTILGSEVQSPGVASSTPRVRRLPDVIVTGRCKARAATLFGERRGSSPPGQGWYRHGGDEPRRSPKEIAAQGVRQT